MLKIYIVSVASRDDLLTHVDYVNQIHQKFKICVKGDGRHER